MKVLWITNIMLPPISEAMGKPVVPVGGWMYSALKRLMGKNNLQMGVATIYAGSDFVKKDVNGIRFYLLPLKGKDAWCYNRHLEKFWQMVYTDFLPDVVHIHGSEMPHGLAFVRACGGKRVVVSVQGLVSVCSRYYELKETDSIRLLTFRDLIKCDGIKQGQKRFVISGEFEKLLFASVKHVIGRTEWDKSHTWALNPLIHYHHVGETLRDTFYNHKWMYEKCEPYTIFVSQANYPIKGLHKLLKAMPLILRHYPETKIIAAGSDEISKPWWRITGYGKYLRRLIKQMKLEGKVTFTGMLSEEQMCNQYLRSNLYICCSAIENSPNSLGEAQLLGMPYLATFSGGIPEIVAYNPKALYRFEEVEMLARKICNIFEIGADFKSYDFDENMYDATINTDLLMATYHQVLQDGCTQSI